MFGEESVGTAAGAPAPVQEKNVLEVEGLRVEFLINKRYIPAVEDVSFHIPEGKTLGIVGESGCGKSVTANSIMGLLPRYTGPRGGGQHPPARRGHAQNDGKGAPRASRQDRFHDLSGADDVAQPRLYGGVADDRDDPRA